MARRNEAEQTEGARERRWVSEGSERALWSQVVIHEALG